MQRPHSQFAEGGLRCTLQACETMVNDGVGRSCGFGFKFSIMGTGA